MSLLTRGDVTHAFLGAFLGVLLTISRIVVNVFASIVLMVSVSLSHHIGRMYILSTEPSSSFQSKVFSTFHAFLNQALSYFAGGLKSRVSWASVI